MNTHPASLFKRLLAIFYDSLLLMALLFVTGIIVSSISTFMINDGNAITAEHPFFVFHRTSVLVTLLAVSFLFFGWFWTHGGQTLGMRTWRLKLQTLDGGNINWSVAGVRFLAAMVSWIVFGLGFIWSLFDKNKRTWHDRMSDTVLIQMEKKK
ncbi:MAG TPA: RDD family protein [Gammaproteobacteria bacterium]